MTLSPSCICDFFKPPSKQPAPIKIVNSTPPPLPLSHSLLAHPLPLSESF